MKEDYSLAGMMKAMLAANGGEPLSAEQEAWVRAMHDKIAEKRKALDDCLANAEERRREAALDAAIERMEEAVQQEAKARKRVRPCERDWGSRNTLVTRAQYDAAKALVMADFQSASAGLGSGQTKVKPPTIYRRAYDSLLRAIRKLKHPIR